MKTIKKNKIVFFLACIFICYGANASTGIVTNTNDSGTGSLRYYLTQTYADTIRFDPALIASGSATINLTSRIDVSRNWSSSMPQVIIGLYNSTDTLFISGGGSWELFLFDFTNIFDGKLVMDSLVCINSTGVSRFTDFPSTMEFDIKNCVFRNNNCAGNSNNGSVFNIYNTMLATTSFNASFYNCSFLNNTGHSGVAIRVSNSTATIRNLTIDKCTFSGNTGNSGSRGGAIEVSSGGNSSAETYVTINRSTFVNNSATYYGAINIDDDPSYKFYVYIDYCTIVGNSSGNSTAAVNVNRATDNGFHRCYVRNNILALNNSSATNKNFKYYLNTTEDNPNGNTFNIFSDVFPVGFTITSNLIGTAGSINLGALQNNGGTTKTRMPGIGSIAIDSGDPAILIDAQNLPIVGVRDRGAAEYSACAQDAVAPVADNASLPDLTDPCSITSLTAPTATDNCAGTINGTHGVTLPINSSSVITWTYDDGNGNTSTQTQNVLITDNTAPVANVATLSNVTSECSVTSLTAPTASDNCAGSITGTHNATLPITAQGTTVVTWTYDDGNGNTSTQTQNVVITDVTAPVADAASLADLTDECEITSLTAPAATDNCAGSVTGTHNATLPITSTTTITWTYDDGNGNTSTQTQQVIINDVTAPVADIATLAAVTTECEVTSLTAPTATDNCVGSITGTHNATLPITAQGATTVTWTYDDGNGNTSTQTQNVVITDVTAPVADQASLNAIITNCGQPVTSLTAPTATDNCAGTITGTHNATLPITSSTTVVWTYDDGNGNTSTQNQTVTINIDNAAPVADMATLSNVTSECSVASLTAPTATDNCAGTITGTHNATLPITTQGTTVVTWTYDDGNGNTSTQTQNVVITDVTAPVADVASLSNITSECSVASLTAPTATDDCAGTITGTHNATLPITAQGTTNVTWTYDDGNGNTSTQTQNVVITDVTAPVADQASLTAIITNCGQPVTSLTASTATDNCAGTIAGIHNATLPITSSTTVVWTYDDGNGNTSTQNQTVTINIDNTAPVADLATLSNITSQCSISNLPAPTATDNCAGSITGTHNATLPITAQGTTMVTWTYDDGNGNTSTQTQNVVITDVTVPVADVASLSNLGAQCSISNLPAPTATDNCAGTITGMHNATLPITTQGTTVVTWTYDDGNGNTSSQTQNVVITNDAPVANIATLSNVTSECSVTSLTAPHASDFCSGSITGTHNATLPITAQGTTVITWTYDDGDGNTSTQTQDVIISPIDNTVTQVDATTLSADASGYNYQWVDCDNGNQAIVGETNQTFVATVNGNYAVEIDNGTCSVISNCMVINQVGIDEILDNELVEVYPNPTNGAITISSKGTFNRIEVLNSLGQKVKEFKITDTSSYSLEMPEEVGVYLVKVYSNESLSIKRVVKR